MLSPAPHAGDPAALAAYVEAVPLTPGGPVGAALEWAREIAAAVPGPGHGRTRDRWDLLAAVATRNLTWARVLEPHLDALAILEEGGAPSEPGTTWGVWAAEGPGEPLRATPGPDGSWTLAGTKSWCSLAAEVDRGLVTAHLPDGSRGLFAVDPHHPSATVEPGTWAPLGLTEVATGSLVCAGTPARAVGGPGWYLTRAGFAWGGAGVAAVWYGGAAGLARRVLAQARRRQPDQVALAHLGALDARLHAARAVLDRAADDIDAGRATGAAGALLAARVRQVVVDVAEDVLSTSAHALGPGPLAHEAEHARRVADLSLYVRQHHAERDLAALGQRLLEDRVEPW